MRQLPTAYTTPGQAGVERPARLWALTLATLVLTLTRLGAYWDVQWHWAVGRDSFFIPPHTLIYAGVAVSGLLGLSMVWRDGVRHRFRRAPRPWGWLILMIGAGITVSAAPFDDLWHRLYGIDVTIWSPPHMVGVLGGWVMNLGLFVLWAGAWRNAASNRMVLLLGLIWSVTLSISFINFGLVPAVRWSVLQPVTPTLYSAIGALLVPWALVALVWMTGRVWTVAVVLLGLILLRILDQWVWEWSLRVVVPWYGERQRQTNLSDLYRHFWVHPLLNASAVASVVVGGWLFRGRNHPWSAALTGMFAGLAMSATVMLLATGRIVRTTPFIDRGRTGADFHAETDLLLRLLGTSTIAALGWALLFGLVSGMAGFALARMLEREAGRAPDLLRGRPYGVVSRPRGAA
jgi:hypothetical protein